MLGRKSGLLSYLVYLTIAGSTYACENGNIVSRNRWEARTPKWEYPLNTPITHIFIGHTVTNECHTLPACSEQMRSMQNYHMDHLNWSDIGYSFVIGGDGRVYEGVGWTREGIHTRGWNDKSYGIAFIGNYVSTRPNDEMLQAARKLITCGIRMGFISKDLLLHGARDGTCTESPGEVLYGIIKEWPRFQGGPLKGYKC